MAFFGFSGLADFVKQNRARPARQAGLLPAISWRGSPAIGGMSGGKNPQKFLVGSKNPSKPGHAGF